jgi:hypothetical protein
MVAFLELVCFWWYKINSNLTLYRLIIRYSLHRSSIGGSGDI